MCQALNLAQKYLIALCKCLTEPVEYKHKNFYLSQENEKVALIF